MHFFVVASLWLLPCCIARRVVSAGPSDAIELNSLESVHSSASHPLQNALAAFLLAQRHVASMSHDLHRAPPRSKAPRAAVEAAALGSIEVQQSSKDPLMVRAARGEVTERVPVWLFRQAGRHLPEYNAYKKQTGKNLLQFVEDPHDTANITLQPVKRYGVDAAILYSDILVVVQALGVKVTMPGGVGIQVPDPLRQPEDLQRLQLPTDSASAAVLVKDKLPHIIEAVRLIVSRLGQEHGDTPLIGFSGAPWTLFYYMVGGNSSRQNWNAGTDFLDRYPAESERILDALQLVVIEYLSSQADAGCKILQMFDAWCDEAIIDRDRFRTLVLPRLAAIKNELKSRHPGVPFMVYARGASYALEDLKESGIDDVLTLDNTVARAGVRDRLPGVCLQGHFDPKLFVSEGNLQDEKAMIRRETKHMLDEIGSKRLIANIQVGLMGKEEPELVDVFVKTVQEYEHKGD